MVEGTCKNGARAVLTFEASQLQVLSPVKANLKLIDKDDQPINSALVYCSLYIPNVATGANNPKLVQSEEGGIYNGVVFFGDAGKWKAALTINFPGGGYEELVLDIGQVMPKKS
ncbi:MAG: hypothetical protein C0624_05420 [Desulfuromonas sp.]|nr:MAG: hypothetical protein C0624_05420 [Desulfuromonas sp.]